MALTHVSNILGTVLDVEKATSYVRTACGERCAVAIDGVAFVPHKAPDVAAYGCDWSDYHVPVMRGVNV